jgi:hypothetical protein
MPPPLTTLDLDRLAAAPQRPVSAALGVAGSSGTETIDGGSPRRAARCTILDLGIVRSRAVAGAVLIDLFAQREERGPSSIRDFAVAALPSTTVSCLGLGQRTPVLENNAEIERRARVAAFVRAPERRLSLGQRPMLCEQHAKLNRGNIVAAIGRATIRIRSLIERPSLPQQHPEPERTIGIATLIGPAVGRLGLGQRPLLFEQSTEVRGGGAMATFIGATIGSLRFNHAPLALEQPTEVESASAVAELIGVTVSRLGLGQRPLLFEQSTEVRGSGAMATLIGVTIGRMRFNHTPFASQLLTEVESASGLGWLGEIVRSSPRQPAVRTIANASRTGFGVMPVGVNLVPVGVGGCFVVAIRRCQARLLQRGRFRVAGRPLCEDGPVLAARAPMPERSDEQASSEYQCQRERETTQNDHPRHASRARPVG